MKLKLILVFVCLITLMACNDNKSRGGLVELTMQETLCDNPWIIDCGTPPMPPLEYFVEEYLESHGLEMDASNISITGESNMCCFCVCSSPTGRIIHIWVSPDDIDLANSLGFY